MPDGTWHEAVIGVFREIGNWMRASTSAELYERILDCEIADEDLEQAFLSGADTRPAPAGISPNL